MIDSSDTQTTELFPVKKPRGRPSTGNALTAAQRSSNYRDRKRSSGDQVSITRWISLEALCRLERIARYQGITESQLIEQLLAAEQERITDSLNDEEFDAYFKK
jgi:hypothetical protein